MGGVQTEKQIQSEILDTFGRLPGLRVWRQNVGIALTPDGRRVVAFGQRGSADVSGILNDGRRLEIEVKSARGRQSKHQRAFQTMIEAFNGVYVLARSVDDVWAGLRDAGYYPKGD